MAENIYDYLQKNNLIATSKDNFQKEVATNPTFAKNVYSHFSEKGLTDKSFEQFSNDHFSHYTEKEFKPLSVEVSPMMQPEFFQEQPDVVDNGVQNIKSDFDFPTIDSPKESISGEPTGSSTNIRAKQINKVSVLPADVFMVDPAKIAKLADDMTKASEENEYKDNKAEWFVKKQTQAIDNFNSRIAINDNNYIYPYVFEGMWVYDDARGVRKAVPDKWIPKPGIVYKVPMKDQVQLGRMKSDMMADYLRATNPMAAEAAVNSSKRWEYMTYTGDKNFPWVRAEKPTITREQQLQPAFVTAKIKRKQKDQGAPLTFNEQFASDEKTSGESLIAGKYFSNSSSLLKVYKTSKEQGGGDALVSIVEKFPKLGQEVEALLNKYGKDYRDRFESQPKFAQSILMEAVTNLSGMNSMLKQDLSYLTTADAMVSQYKSAQENIQARFNNMVPGYFKKLGVYEDYLRLQEIGKYIEKNKSKIQDLNTVIEWHNKAVRHEEIPQQLSDRVKEIRQNGFMGIMSEESEDLESNLKEYSDLMKRLQPHIATALDNFKIEGNTLRSQYEQNNQRFSEYKSKVSALISSVNDLTKNQDGYNQAFNYIYTKAFPGQNKIDEKQLEFDKKVMDGDNTLGDDIISGVGAAMRSLLGLTKSLKDAGTFPILGANQLGSHTTDFLGLDKKDEKRGGIMSDMGNMLGSLGYSMPMTSPFAATSYLLSQTGDAVGNINSFMNKSVYSGYDLIDNKFQSISPEFEAWARNKKLNIRGWRGQSSAKTLGEMVPTIAALMLLKRPAGAISETTGLFEFNGMTGAAARLASEQSANAFSRAVTFGSTYMSVLPKMEIEAQNMRLSGPAYDIFTKGSAFSEAIFESFLTPDRIIKDGFGTALVRNLLKGRITKANAGYYIKDFIKNNAKIYFKDFPIEEMENIGTNLFNPIINLIANKYEGRDLLSTDVKLAEANEVITTFDTVALMGASGSVSGTSGAAAMSAFDKYAGNITSSAMSSGLKMYQNNPAIFNKIIESMSRISPTQANSFQNLIHDYEESLNSMPDGVTDNQKIAIFQIHKKINDRKEQLSGKSISEEMKSALESDINDLKKSLTDIVKDPNKADEEVNTYLEESNKGLEESLNISQENRKKNLQRRQSGLVDFDGETEETTPAEGLPLDAKNNQIRNGNISLMAPYRTMTTKENQHLQEESSIAPHSAEEIRTESQAVSALSNSDVATFFNAEIENPETEVEIQTSTVNGEEATLKAKAGRVQSFLKEKNINLHNILNCVLK